MVKSDLRKLHNMKLVELQNSPQKILRLRLWTLRCDYLTVEFDAAVLAGVVSLTGHEW